ncbi:MAG: hypothetical protein EA428_16070 [Spirochaetaceae bacterium]|nr:MAG: hypothetical protein EA428_16070 [Spirochaetaceae bacterium]
MPARAILLLTFLIASLFVTAGPLSAKTVREAPVSVFDPVLMAQGDSSVASARGYRSLFINPAAFALGQGNFTLLNLQGWIHSSPTQALESMQLFFGESDIEEGDTSLSRLERQLSSNGMGVGAAGGIGYVGGGLGLGLRFASDSYFFGEQLPGGITGTSTSEISFVGGLGFPFQLGPVQVAIGGSVRPFVRVRSLFDSDASDAALQKFLGVPGEIEEDYRDITRSLNGYGFALDAGLLLQYRDFTLGIAGRHLGDTRLNYSEHSLSEVRDSLSNGALPAEKSEGEEGYIPVGQHIIPTRFDFGLMWAPRPWDVARPQLHLELRDPMGWADPSGTGSQPLLYRTHLGGELELMRFFSIRAGLNQGRPTGGLGLRLFFFDLNMALYGRELGEQQGDTSSAGAALEFGIRF